MANVRRTPITVAMALLWLVALAAPAHAHSAAGEDATNFRTRLLSVTPATPGLDVEIIENGNRIQVTNATDQQVVVLGYQGEPYLRIGPDGVAENVRSPATYLNQDRQGTTSVPGEADPDAEPEWSPISDANVARWHDHRIHWMGGEDPPIVREQPGQRHTVIPEWSVPLRVGGTAVEVKGDLVWVPGPSVAPWLALAAALLAVTLIAAWWPRAWRPALAAAVAVLVAADMVHALGIGFAGVGGVGSQMAQLVTGSFVSIAGWIAGVASVILLVRGNDAGVVAAGLAGTLIAINGGIADLGVLGRSQLIFAWPDNLLRAAIAVALGLGLGLAGGSGLRLVRSSPRLVSDN
jgi:hypothetical protein